jgi:hypothetical protein
MRIIILMITLLFTITLYAAEECTDPTQNVVGTVCGCDSAHSEYVTDKFGKSTCKPKCNIGFERVGTACKKRCRSNYERDRYNICRKSVDDSGSKICSKGMEEVEGVCLVACHHGEIRKGKICIRQCLSKHFELVDNKCIIKCASNQIRDRFGRCAFEVTNKTCNAATSEIVDNKCVKKCNPSQERVDGRCRVRCTTGLERVGLHCKPACQKNFKRNDQGICAYCKS